MASYQFTDENEIKIFILYLLKNMNRPLLFSEVNDMVRQDELVNYMDFAECLGQLVRTGNVFTRITGAGLTYEITPQGRQVADTLESNIMGYIRTKSLKSALRYLSFKDSGTKIAVQKSPRADGRMDMSFTVTQKGDTALSVTLIADNDYQARQMEYNFKTQPETVYKSILSLLAGDAGYFLK
ncbi:MAG: DUF4364 family protein [Clostridia bacterium]|nr:DUF4364 family protein [Clostridia bacterium]MBQ8235856.1 DUF4364 family protein [Clostridia bacterium]MBQ8399420.1 DUF4364 family protein [Clostridia bacterium]